MRTGWHRAPPGTCVLVLSTKWPHLQCRWTVSVEHMESADRISLSPKHRLALRTVSVARCKAAAQDPSCVEMRRGHQIGFAKSALQTRGKICQTKLAAAQRPPAAPVSACVLLEQLIQTQRAAVCVRTAPTRTALPTSSCFARSRSCAALGRRLCLQPTPAMVPAALAPPARTKLSKSIGARSAQHSRGVLLVKGTFKGGSPH